MLLELALGLDNLFRDRPDLELALVMIICPLVVNITQARGWVSGCKGIAWIRAQQTREIEGGGPSV